MSLLIVGLDVTIVNVALPSIARELHATVSGLQWTVDAYTLVLASLLMLSGSMADRFGRRRLFKTGLVLFTLGSLLCSVAPALGWLIVFRMLQAVGGSMLNPVAMAIIRNVFTDAARARMGDRDVGRHGRHQPRARSRARRSAGGLGGVAVDLLDQHSRGPRRPGADHAVRARVACSAPTAHRSGGAGARDRAAGLADLRDHRGPLRGLALGADDRRCSRSPRPRWRACSPYEPRRTDPLLELRFFRSIPFSSASAIAVCAFAALGGFLFLNTLYLQDVRGLSALTAGLYTLPIAAMTLLFAPLSGRLVGRRGPRMSLLAGGLGLTLGAALLTGLGKSTPLASLFPAYFVFGIGFGMVNPPITNTAVSGMPPAQAGVAAAVASTSRQVGSTLGVAIVGAVAAAGVGSVGPGFVQASHAGWWIITGCGLAVLLLGLISTTGWANASARRTVAEFGGHRPDLEPGGA